jgi:hypothetical protein
MLKWIKDYITGPTHKWWVDNVWRPSWTKFTSWVVGIPAALVAVGQYVSNFMQDVTIQSYLAQFDIPNWVPSTLTLIALIYYVASGRK